MTTSSVFMLVWRKKQLIISTVDTIAAIWIAYTILRAYVNPVYPCANFYIRAIQMFSLYIGARLLFSSGIITERILVIGIILCAGYEMLSGILQVWNGNSRHHLYAMSGTFLNPGPYSVFLAMGLVISAKLKKGYWLSALFAILLLATCSRAALVAAAICIGITYWDKWKHWKWKIALAVFVISIGFYFLKKGSADGRFIIYMISFLNILQYPIFGSGIGSFCHQYAEGMAAFSSKHPTFNFLSADVTSNAYNILLQIGIEQGIIGLSLATAVVTIMFVRLSKKANTLGMCLLCLLIFSMFSYPFEQLPYQIIFVLIAAYAATGQARFAISTKWRLSCRSYFNPIALFCCVILSSLFIHKQIKERYLAESDYRIIAGANNVIFINNFYKLLPLMASSERFLFDLGKLLSANGRYHDSNAILLMGTNVSCDPMFYILQGNNYYKMGLYQDAEQVYKKAYNVMPNRLYPLYQLMLLYKKTGNTKKMYTTAHQVMTFKEKVVSSETREMK